MATAFYCASSRFLGNVYRSLKVLSILPFIESNIRVGLKESGENLTIIDAQSSTVSRLQAAVS
jgi:hypothetical protein